MSDWGSYEIDDAVWDELRVTGDHNVPDLEDTQESAWTVKGESCEILNAVARSSEQKTLGNKNGLPGKKEVIFSCASTKEELLPQMLDMDMWYNLQYEDLATAYNSLNPRIGTGNKAGKEGVISNCCKDVKPGSADNDLIRGVYKEDPLLEDSNATLVNNSCQFSLTDACPPECDLNFFGNEHEDKQDCSLLDYGWAHIDDFEDVDRLLRHTMNSSADELRWPSSSSNCVQDIPSRIVQHGMATSCPELRALKVKSQQYDVKMEFVPCNNSSSLTLSDQKHDSMANNCQQNDFILYSNRHAEQMCPEYMQKSLGRSTTQSKSSCEEKPLQCSERSKGTTESQREREKEDIQVTSNCMDMIDDAVWDELRVNGEHIVPDPEDTREIAWMVNGECSEILNAVARSSEQKTLGSKNGLPGEKEAILSCPSTEEEPLSEMLDMDMWYNLQYEDLATPYNSLNPHVGKGSKARKEGVIGNCCKDVKPGSADNDLIRGVYKEDPLLEDSNATLVNNSCHFSLTDACPPESSLIFFGNEHKDKQSCSLLDYGWANIENFEDVDRLLRHTMNSSADELRWPSSSSDCVHDIPSRIVQHGRVPFWPELRALKVKSQQYEARMEFVPCINSSSLTLLDQKGDSMANNCEQNDSISYSNRHAEQMCPGYMQRSLGRSDTQSKSSCEEKPLECSGRSKVTTESQPETGKEDIQATSNCMDMNNSYRKRRNAHPEENHEKQLSNKRVTQGLPSVMSYSKGSQVPQFKPAETQTLASSATQVIPVLANASEKYLGENSSSRLLYPQVPCMDSGNGYSLHHKPISHSLSNLSLQIEQSQPVLVDHYLPEDTTNQQQQVRRPVEIPVTLPIMTLQEKIEKLRWRQEMQARLAVEHQQRKFGAWNASMDYFIGQKQLQKIQCHHATVDPKEGNKKILQTSKEESQSSTGQENSSIDCGKTCNDDDGGSMEATVLHQLLSTMTQLDIRTRLGLRDALYRLASNAMQRCSVGDTNSNSRNNSEQIGKGGTGTSVSSKQSQSNRYIRMNDVETETNPIDRFICHLLYHKCSMPSEAPAPLPSGSGDSFFFHEF